MAFQPPPLESLEDEPKGFTPPPLESLEESAVKFTPPPLSSLEQHDLELEKPSGSSLRFPSPAPAPANLSKPPTFPEALTKFQQVKTGLSDFSQSVAKIAQSVADDLVAGKPEFSGNIPAMISGEQLPYEKTIQDITKSNPKTAIVAQAAQNVVGTAPQLFLPGAGLPKLAWRALSAFFTYSLLKNAKPTAEALGDEYGKAPEDRDPNKLRDLWASAIEDTGFSILTGYGAAKPGIATESAAIRKALTKSVVEAYPPEQLRDIFTRVTTGQATPEENELYKFIAANTPELRQAVKKGVKVVEESPRFDYDALNKYLGIKPSTKTLTVGDENYAAQNVPIGGSVPVKREGTVPLQLIEAPQQAPVAGTDIGNRVPDKTGRVEAQGVVPAPPPEVPKVVTATDLLAMTPEQVVTWKKAAPYGPQMMLSMASAVKPDDIPKLVEQRDALRKQAQDLLTQAADNPTHPAWGQSQVVSVKAQTLNEMIENAPKPVAAAPVMPGQSLPDPYLQKIRDAATAATTTPANADKFRKKWLKNVADQIVRGRAPESALHQPIVEVVGTTVLKGSGESTTSHPMVTIREDGKQVWRGTENEFGYSKPLGVIYGSRLTQIDKQRGSTIYTLAPETSTPIASLTPALMVNGKPVEGSGHKAIMESLQSGPDAEAALLALGDDSQHVFIARDAQGNVIGKPLSRTEAGPVWDKLKGNKVGTTKSLHSEMMTPAEKPAASVPINGGRATLSGGDKFHSDISGMIYQVHNEGAVLDVVRDGTDYPVRVNVRDYKNVAFEAPKPEPAKNLVTPKPTEVTKPDLGQLRENKIKGGTAASQRAANDIALRVAPLLGMNRIVGEKNPGAAYDPDQLGLISDDKIDEVGEYLRQQYNKVVGQKPPLPVEKTPQEIQPKAPELMTPIEFRNSMLDGFTANAKAEIKGIRDHNKEKGLGSLMPSQNKSIRTLQARIKEHEAEKQLAEVSSVFQRYHREAITKAADQKLPLNAEAVEFHKSWLPKGYVREGDLYVFKPEAVSPKPAAVPAVNEVVETALANGYRTEKAFTKDFEKNSLKKYNESQEEFLKRRVCSETVPVKRKVLSND